MTFRKGNVPWNKTDTYIFCEICGKKKYIRLAQLVTSKYGSIKCKNEGMRDFIPWNKGKKLSKNHRGKLGTATAKAWREGKHRDNPTSSGKPAWNSGKIMLQTSGSKNHNWKGGITSLMMQIRRCRKYKNWTRNILEKDDFTCHVCRKRGCVLNADHIRNFADIIGANEIDTYNKAIACPELWDLFNGRAICVPCHRQVTFEGGGGSY